MKKNLFIKASIIIGLILMLSLTNCEIVDPKPLRWLTKFYIPIFSKIYYISDLTTDANIVVTPNGTMQFLNGEPINDAEVAETDLKISEDPIGTGQIEALAGSLGTPNPIPLKGSDNDVEIKEAVFGTAFLIFDFKNLSSTIDHFTFRFTEIYADGGMLSFDINPNETNLPFKKALRGYSVQDNNQPKKYLKELNFTYSIYPSDWAENAIKKGEDPTVGTIQIYYDEPLLFSSIYGKVNELKIDIDDFSSDIETDYPDNIENAIELNDTRLIFNMTNHTGFDGYYSAIITSKNGDAERSLTIKDMRIERAATHGKPKFNTIEVSDKKDQYIESGTVTELFQIMPTIIEISESQFVLDNKPVHGAVDGFIFEGNAFQGDYKAEVDFDFTFIPGVPVRPVDFQNTKFALSEDVRKDIKENTQDIAIIIRITSTFDFGVIASLYMCSSSEEDEIFVPKEEFLPGFSRLYFPNIRIPEEKKGKAVYDTLYINEDTQLSIFYDHPELFFGMEFEFEEGSAIIKKNQKVQIFINLTAERWINSDGIKLPKY